MFRNLLLYYNLNYKNFLKMYYFELHLLTLIYNYLDLSIRDNNII